MNIVAISAEPRTELGKKAAKTYRKEGKIPAVIYSKNGVSHFTTVIREVKPLVYTPDFKLAEIHLNGAKHKAILQDIVFHPVTSEIEHIDFLELLDDQPVKASIPVKFKGVSPGVKAGGKLITTMRTVKVKALPADLVDELFVDISKLKLGDAARVREIEVPAGLEVLVEGATPVANVEIPRALKSATAKAELGADDDEDEGDDA